MQSVSPETPLGSAKELTGWKSALWVLWVISAAFGTYFCMYGFRKPFTAASYEGSEFWGIGFKTILVTSQVAGYMVSKFIGIKVIAELPASKRATMILWLVLFSELALVMYGVTPRPWSAIWLFFNGLPLGMTFGLILGFLEGRRLTELLTAGLCASFILADGVTKTVGTWLLNQGVTEEWMPAAAGGVYLLPLMLGVWMLTWVSPPTSHDIAARSERTTMTSSDRKQFLKRYALGLTPLIMMYLLVTIVRSLRADFQPEIWRGLGVEAPPSTFTTTEMWVALGIMLANGLVILIKDNRLAFYTALSTCALGCLLLAWSLTSLDEGSISNYTFMVTLGLGLYLPYVAFHTTVFERLLGMTREKGNLGFLLYVADSVGYLGYVAVMVGRNFLNIKVDILSLLKTTAWLTIIVSFACIVISYLFFRKPTASELAMKQIVPEQA